MENNLDQLLYSQIQKKYPKKTKLDDLNTILRGMRKINEGIFLANSIDNFINLHSSQPEITTAAKLLIAYCLLQAERNSTLFIEEGTHKRKDFQKVLKKNSNSWLDRFSRILLEKASTQNLDALVGNFGIISFNYDRCVQQYLQIAFEYTLGLSAETSRKLVNQIEIFYPYGSLGPINIEGGSPFIPYGADARYYDLWTVADQIKTFNEQVQNEGKAKIEALVSNSKNIVFLGSAFHPQNMDLLRSQTANPRKRIYATGLGIYDQEKYEVEKRLWQMVAKESEYPTIDGPAWRGRVILEIGSTSKDLLEMHYRNLSTHR